MRPNLAQGVSPQIGLPGRPFALQDFHEEFGERDWNWQHS
jgi:hypothetical protein